MAILNNLLQTKLAASDGLVIGLNRELEVKQGYIEELR
jgi:hypothetical protein